MAESSRRASITKRTVDAAKQEAVRYTLWDTELRGFGLRVAPTGSKTFIARYRVGGGRRGKLRQYVIGQYGKLTPAEARETARKALAEATKGGDPQAAKAASRAELTVAELCDLYFIEGCGLKKASTVYIDRTRVARHIKPILGAYKVSEVDRAAIERFMREVAAGKTKAADAPYVRGGKPAAARAVGLLSGIFAFAIERKMRRDNPAQGVKRYPDVKRERFLSPKEMATLGDALNGLEAEGYDGAPIAALRLLALTGARKNEIARLQWCEVDAARSLIRLGDSKTGAKVIPLGAAALMFLDGLPRGGGPYVFADPRDPLHPVHNMDWTWVRVRNRAGLSDVRVHDLRHSFASTGLASGQALPLIGKLLGHTQVSTTARYAHLADDPVKAAADRISASIASAMRGDDGGVVQPLPRKRA
jgi:integrase